MGDTLINAYVSSFSLNPFKEHIYLFSRYYVLREDMLGYYVNDLVERLNAKREEDGWQVSSIIHIYLTLTSRT